MSHSFIQNRLLLYNSKFHRINDEQLDTISSLILLMLTLPSYCLCVWSAPSRQCPPVNPFTAPLGLKISWPKTNSKTWVHVTEVTRHRQSS